MKRDGAEGVQSVRKEHGYNITRAPNFLFEAPRGNRKSSVELRKALNNIVRVMGKTSNVLLSLSCPLVSMVYLLVVLTLGVDKMAQWSAALSSLLCSHSFESMFMKL